ncbi:hypothetical protein QTO34_015690 [Cnephaeus nilssonii]|uniref:U6 snRNA-associated Sm-like protein LSm7 n=1 Tax=Cnephaeus nilssonii TaxID=3371016 RepID=A0AA40I4K5_CNENI|nr:hypothetical protein QTO34_015690 [Eptesicus nilssonii]
MLAGPSHRRRQMFPSNAPARRAAQAHCRCRASVRSGVKGHGGGASAEAARRVQDGGERGGGRRGPAGAEGPAALPASRAVLPPQDKEKKKKESILDLSKYIDKTIRVKFQGGREASGILKGFDPLLNLVLDGTIEYMRDPDDQYKLTEDTRQLGLVVCRGTSVVLICPQDGMEAIPNPFIQQQEA